MSYLFFSHRQRSQDQLKAVIGRRIVTGGNHNAAFGFALSQRIIKNRRRHRANVQHPAAGSRQFPA